MSKLLNGSICLTTLIEAAKAKHSAFTKAENGKIYFNFSQWINDTPDQFNNDSSLLLNSSKEMREIEEKTYIGNAKFSKAKDPAPITDNDIASDIPPIDDLPF